MFGVELPRFNEGLLGLVSVAAFGFCSGSGEITFRAEEYFPGTWLDGTFAKEFIGIDLFGGCGCCSINEGAKVCLLKKIN